MMKDFASVFSGLRRESGKSQRTAAQEMNISQALLSHYENGVREPRLEFVAKACDYYGVSADYMLGRSNSKRGLSAATEEETDPFFELLSASGQVGNLLFSAWIGRLSLMLCMAAEEDVCPKGVSLPLLQQQCFAEMAADQAGLVRELAEVYSRLNDDTKRAILAQARKTAETMAFSSERAE